MDDFDAAAKFVRLLRAAPAVAVSQVLALVGSVFAAAAALDWGAWVAALAMAATLVGVAGGGFWLQGRIERVRRPHGPRADA